MSSPRWSVVSFPSSFARTCSTRYRPTSFTFLPSTYSVVLFYPHSKLFYGYEYNKYFSFEPFIAGSLFEARSLPVPHTQ